MRSKEFLFYCFLFLQFVSFSQKVSVAQQARKDSLTNKLRSDSVHIFRPQKLRPFFNIDQRNSFIRSAPINVNGIQLGVLVKDRHVFGLGAYTITQNAKQKVKTKTDKNIDVNRTLEIRYATVFYEYAVIDKRYFELDLNVEFGRGNFNLNLYDVNTNHLVLNRNGNFWVSGLGPQIAIKPFRWVGIQGMAGYRFTFGTSANFNFNGFYYGYGLWLDIRQIIRDTRYYLVKKPKYKKQLHQLEQKSN